MKKLRASTIKYFCFFGILLVSINACGQKKFADKPDIDPQVILKDFISWWNYNYTHVDLSANFMALDGNDAVISKESFLQQLGSGEFIALNISSKEPGAKLRLYKLDGSVGNDIRSNAKNVGLEAYSFYKMEGTPLPGSGFTDLNGKVYNKETLKNKILVLKCWFIHCQSCVAEMPALNKAIKQYKDRDDIVFVSLATDTQDELKIFLTKIKFDYAVVAGKGEYMSDQLHITGYPTHLLINKEGTIAKVANRYEQILSALDEEIKR